MIARSDRPFERVELLGREQLLTNAADLEAGLKAIKNTTIDQVQNALRQALSSKLSFNARGGLANRLPTFDKL